MKLNYRDSMILVSVLAVAIVLIGFFTLIKPKMEEIKTDNATLATTQQTWDGVAAKIDEIPGLQEAIQQGYKDSLELSGDFIDRTTIDETYKLDQLMQPYIDEFQLEAKVVDLSETTTSALPYYYFKPDVITTSMFDAADVNGNYRAEIEKLQEESVALSQRNAETVMVTRYGFMAKGTKENIWKFMDKINSLGTTILIDSVNIADYTFGEAAREAGEIDVDNTSEVTFVISLYSAVDMDEPVVE